LGGWEVGAYRRGAFSSGGCNCRPPVPGWPVAAGRVALPSAGRMGGDRRQGWGVAVAFLSVFSRQGGVKQKAQPACSAGSGAQRLCLRLTGLVSCPRKRAATVSRVRMQDGRPPAAAAMRFFVRIRRISPHAGEPPTRAGVNACPARIRNQPRRGLETDSANERVGRRRDAALGQEVWRKGQAPLKREVPVQPRPPPLDSSWGEDLGWTAGRSWR